jgi:hypothetical protein
MNATIISVRNEPAEAIHLLVIDDDLIQRKIIARLGARAGYEVIEAATFDDAEKNLKPESSIVLPLIYRSANKAVLFFSAPSSTAETGFRSSSSVVPTSTSCRPR